MADTLDLFPVPADPIRPPPIRVVHLWGEPETECGICETWGPHRNAVGWYCGPVRADIGAPVPEWGPDAIACGRVVCRPCHDDFYGIPAPDRAGLPPPHIQKGA